MLKWHLRAIIILLLIFVLLLILVSGQAQSNYWQSQKYTDLIDKLEKIGFSKVEIEYIFSDSQIEFYPNIVRKIKTARVPNLAAPNSELLSENSVNKGREFIRGNRKVLEKIEKEYEVEKEVIVSILRIEGRFGKAIDGYQVFGVLNSIILYSELDSDLSKWAKEQLTAFLIICRRLENDFFKTEGSWAGAFGIPQFIPTSYLEFGVDGNKDGKVDLFNLEDALYSIANYLVKNGWQKNKSKALYAYNHSLNYVEGVQAYAKKLQDKD